MKIAVVAANGKAGKLIVKGITVGVMTRDENGDYQVELREPAIAEEPKLLI